MYRPDEMALILEQARQEAKKQQLGSIEPGKAFTFDGDSTGKTVVGDIYVKISGETLDIGNVASFTFTNNGKKTVVTSDMFDIIDGTTIFVGADEFVFTPPEGVGLESGLYVLCYSADSFVSRVEFTDIIHPIPQEYIPPLDRLILNGTDGVRYKLYVDAAGQLQVEVV